MQDPHNLEKTALKITAAVGSPISIVIHSILFIASFALAAWGFVDFDRMLLVLTTVVSLEAIYLAIFIQMTINYQGQSIAEVQEDVEEISEDVGEIQEDVEELQEDVEEISEDVGEISEDVEEMTEEDAEEEADDERQEKAIVAIHADLQRLLVDIEKLKNPKNGA
jgi:septal ring factor EnvC (AmiA/AmiB activator)